MKVREALAVASQALRAAGLPEAQMESEFLVAAALHIPRTHLILEEALAVSPEIQARIGQWAARRSQRQPLAYVVGEQPFLDFSLHVTPAVLIPRPETELLVERAFLFLEKSSRQATVVDVGAGSGNITIALARHPRVDRVLAIDLSHEALAVAQSNARRYGVYDRCRWMTGDLLDPLKDFGGTADLIAANLPYVRADEWLGLQEEVRCEPRLALEGGPTGLETIFRLLEPAHQRLRPGGALFLEVGAGQAKAVEERLRQTGRWSSIQSFKDLAGWPRILQAVKGAPWTS